MLNFLPGEGLLSLSNTNFCNLSVFLHFFQHYFGRSGKGLSHEVNVLGLYGNTFCCGPTVVYSKAVLKGNLIRFPILVVWMIKMYPLLDFTKPTKNVQELVIKTIYFRLSKGSTLSKQ